jgi:hypothetical protein
MPRIAAITLEQLNGQFDKIDSLQNQLAGLQKLVSNVGHQTIISDPLHAPQTSNNITFTWTGGTGVLSWTKGWIKDKNWNAQSINRTPVISSAPGQQHIFTVPAGSLVLSPSTTYWLGWDPHSQTMQATQDASSLHGKFGAHIICQIFTGTGGQTGTAGGGGSTGGSDLSGARYKNF